MFIFVLNQSAPMKKLFYFAIGLVIIGSASSCSKQCVQCQAKDQYGVVINQSNVICEHDFNRKNFEKRYTNDFQGYKVTCANQ